MSDCFCSTDRSGADAGCACVTIEDTPLGPRFRESPSEPRGDGGYLEAALRKFDAEQRELAKAGPPACGMVRKP
jgi:hypothetical protein